MDIPLILIVEDDAALANGLLLALRGAQHAAEACGTLAAARARLSDAAAPPPSLLLLDVNLPDGSGLDFLREMKNANPDTDAAANAAHPALPVILLTANDTEMDIVAGLGLGADDYVTKPFSLAVLRARVDAALRRSTQRAAAIPPQTAPIPHEAPLTLGAYRFDFARMEFSRAGIPVELSKTEQKLLRLLVEHRGVTLTRAALVDRVWTDGAQYVDENALSVTVKRLRDKLDAHEILKTVYGLGYVWAVENV